MKGSSYILGLWDWIKVSRIHAGRRVTEMVKHHPFGDRPDEILVGVSMDESRVTFVWEDFACHAPITALVTPARPEPTAIPSSGVIYARPEKAEPKLGRISTHRPALTLLFATLALGCKLSMHLKGILSGVVRAAVQAVCPLSFYHAGQTRLMGPTPRKGN